MAKAKQKQPVTKQALILKLAKSKTRSLEEIADEVGTTRNSVASVLSRARAAGLNVPLRA